MSTSASFTGSNSVRYPAPDVARGFMLVLIAVANAPIWIQLFPDTADTSTADRVWILIRSLFVDHRAYPLFSMLFGFGLMTMVMRRHDSHVATRTAELDAKAPGLVPQARQGWLAGFEEEAYAAGRTLVRRRGYWMLLFGAVHALFFFGDIIGAYALVGIIFAGVIAKRRWRLMAVVGVIQTVVMILMMIWQQYSIEHMVGSSSISYGLNSLVRWYYPLASFFSWIPSTVMTILLATVLPASFIGARLAATDIVSRPDLHRGALTIVAVAGLGLGAAMGAPKALADVGLADWNFLGSHALHEFGGLFGAAGWLALLVLFAGPPRESITGIRHLLSSVGKRSMTAYLTQTILFIAIFALAGLAGVRQVGAVAGLLIGVGVWGATVVVCWVLEKRGHVRGPFEVLLRRAVARSATPQVLPQVPIVPVQTASLGDAGVVSAPMN